MEIYNIKRKCESACKFKRENEKKIKINKEFRKDGVRLSVERRSFIFFSFKKLCFSNVSMSIESCAGLQRVVSEIRT